MTTQDLELIDLLRSINPKKDFIVGIMSYARSQSERKRVLDFIKAGDDVDEETVTVLAIDISNDSNNET